MVDGLSILIGLVSFAAVGIHGIIKKRKEAGGRAIRVGLAATPIPVFLIMPLIPYDKDLAEVLADERTILALAAAVGLIWTGREVWKAFKDD